MANLNLGILAHVDAGKTTLTERILYQAGVIAAPGSVDKGTTQTDSRDLERARGITIWSAVASFRLGELTVNLIDTPGHGDFIAEVARALDALDAVVLVVSAVAGVPPQTRRLARAIRAAAALPSRGARGLRRRSQPSGVAARPSRGSGHSGGEWRGRSGRRACR